MGIRTRHRCIAAVGLRHVAAAILLCGGLGGCAGTPEEEPRTVYYRCADSARFGVTPVQNDRIELSRSPNRYTLKQVEAGSGVEYASSKASFWNQGEEARIEVGDKRYTECKLDSLQSDPESVSRLHRIFLQGGSSGMGGQR